MHEHSESCAEPTCPWSVSLLVLFRTVGQRRRVCSDKSAFALIGRARLNGSSLASALFNLQEEIPHKTPPILANAAWAQVHVITQQSLQVDDFKSLTSESTNNPQHDGCHQLQAKGHICGRNPVASSRTGGREDDIRALGSYEQELKPERLNSEMRLRVEMHEKVPEMVSSIWGRHRTGFCLHLATVSALSFQNITQSLERPIIRP